jgi:hypothetical protein
MSRRANDASGVAVHNTSLFQTSLPCRKEKIRFKQRSDVRRVVNREKGSEPILHQQTCFAEQAELIGRGDDDPCFGARYPRDLPEEVPRVLKMFDRLGRYHQVRNCILEWEATIEIRPAKIKVSGEPVVSNEVAPDIVGHEWSQLTVQIPVTAPDVHRELKPSSIGSSNGLDQL